MRNTSVSLKLGLWVCVMTERMTEIRDRYQSDEQWDVETLCFDVPYLVARVTELEARLCDMTPLLSEARDALPGISLTSAKLRGIRLDLGDRMDDVGHYETWKKNYDERQAVSNE